MTCCTKVCNFLSSFWLQIFNFLDLAVGCILLSFGIYVKFVLPDDGTLKEHQALLLIGWTSFILGLLFLLVALFSFCGIVSNSCRFAVIPSGYIALLLGVFSLSAGIAAVLCNEEVLKFVDENQERLNMTPQHVEVVHVFYDIICIVFFTSFVVELMRFGLSSQYHATSNLMDIDNDIEVSSRDRDPLLRADSGRYQTADNNANAPRRYDPYAARMNSSGSSRYEGRGYSRQAAL